jgi:hypothetical protein
MTSTTTPPISSVAIDDVTSLKERSLAARLFASQPFWVTVALIVMCAVMSAYQPQAFATAENFYNITRNFAFVGLMAISPWARSWASWVWSAVSCSRPRTIGRSLSSPASPRGRWPVP